MAALPLRFLGPPGGRIFHLQASAKGRTADAGYPPDPFTPAAGPPALSSRLASSMSLSIMIFTSSAKLVFGFHPSAFVAFDGSPSR
jgi:hypothetical protein